MLDRLKNRNRHFTLAEKPIRFDKRHIILSAAVMLFMVTLSFLGWDGIPKRLIICLGLSVLSGALLLLPKLSNWASVPLLALYLWYVPVKIFQRMELPIHDMSRILDGAALLTALFVICVYLLVFIFTQSSGAALGAGSGFFLILFLIEYYLWKFRGDFLLPSDLRAVGTAVTVMKNYDYGLSPEAIYSVIYFLFFIVLGSRIRIRMHKWVHVGVSVAAALFIGGWYYTVMHVPNPLGKEFIINYWSIGDTRNMNGACLSYFLLVKDSRLDVPDNYSEEAVQVIARNAAEQYEASDSALNAGKSPAIIMIMNEAWSDLRVLGTLETTEPYMPFTESLTENTLHGNLYVSILGGLTANTEFEALTGDSLALLAPGVVPYQNQVSHDMASLAKVLENQGYTSMAMHPSGTAGWSRGKVYGYFGFDDYIHQGAWGVPYEYVGSYISDACNFNEIIRRYEERDRSAPFFLFDVTIQNHGGYSNKTPMDIGLVQIGETSAEEMGSVTEVQSYINLIRITDEAFRDFVMYFEQVEEPVILCMFGDHQPWLSEAFYDTVFAGQDLSEKEQNLRKYIVPYVIWANYEVDWKEYGDMSANYIPAVLMECAGLELPPYYQFLMGLHATWPVLTQKGCLDREGNLLDIADLWDTELIYQYRMLQYNQLCVRKYQKPIFEGAAVSEE
ncbi:MAG: LTA synthase family protein [Butyrivibrio sp.]|nr:LTA synthase family protein [Acetatifactor muris]MCM1558557.1 LTA synthase family protein [Butyrivibrio sp.]